MRDPGRRAVSTLRLHLEEPALRAVVRLELHAQPRAGARDVDAFTDDLDRDIPGEGEAAMVGRLRREDDRAVPAGHVERVRRAGEQVVRDPERVGDHGELDVLPLDEEGPRDVRRGNGGRLIAAEAEDSEAS